MPMTGRGLAQIILSIVIMSAAAAETAPKPDARKSQAALRRGQRADEAGRRNEALAA